MANKWKEFVCFNFAECWFLIVCFALRLVGGLCVNGLDNALGLLAVSMSDGLFHGWRFLWLVCEVGTELVVNLDIELELRGVEMRI